MKRIVITGASGTAGSLIRPLLRARHQLTLYTRARVDLAHNEVGIVGALDDSAALARAFAGADAIVHLAGISIEGDFHPMIDTNIRGTHQVLEAARAAGVRRVLVASSGHAVGGTPIERAYGLRPEETDPSSFYGASKVAVEAIARVHAHKYRMSVVIARIGTILAEPLTQRHLSTWLSPGDMVRLIDATLALDRSGAWTVWAVSANARRWVDLAPGQAIGYVPQDNSEAFAPTLLADPADASLQWDTLGGPWYGPAKEHRWPNAV